MIKKICIAALVSTLCIIIIGNYNILDKKKISFQENKEFISLNNKKIPNTQNLKLFFSLDPECPLSISYSSTINKLAKKYNSCDSNNIDFLIVIPSISETTKIKELAHMYKPALKCWDTINNKILNNTHIVQYPGLYLDYNHDIINIIDAKITPECFLIDADGKTLYRGAIDNWVSQLGRRKQYINKHYLENAIIQYKNNETIKIPITEAIGCIIQR